MTEDEGERTKGERRRGAHALRRVVAGALFGALALGLTPACSSSPSEVVLFRAGSRLKGRYFVGAGGTKQRVGVYDAGLDSDCSFEPTTAGLRCVPRSAAVAFADAACTRPILRWSGRTCGRPPTYFSGSVPSLLPGAGAATVVYARGARIDTRIFARGAAACAELTHAAGDETYEASLVDLSRLVEVTDRSIRVAGGVAIEQAIASDGASYMASARSATSGEPCYADALDESDESWLTDYRGALACVPSSAHVVDRFADATCSQDAVTVYPAEPSSTAVPPRIASKRRVRKEGSCTKVRTERYELGPSVPVPYALEHGFSCKPVTAPSAPAFALGPRIDDAIFPRVTRVDQGTGRLRSGEYHVDGQPIASGPLVYDGHPCELRTFPDGVRCVFKTVVRSSRSYADASCSREIVGTTLCDAAYVLFDTVVACPFGSRTSALPQADAVYELGATVEAPVVFRSGPAGCVRELDPGYTTFREVGREVDPAALFPKLVERVE